MSAGSVTTIRPNGRIQVMKRAEGWGILLEDDTFPHGVVIHFGSIDELMRFTVALNKSVTGALKIARHYVGNPPGRIQ